MNGNNGPTDRVLILITVGFEEIATIYCLSFLREAGFHVSLIGLSAGLIKGSHGLVVRPDFTFDQLPSTIQPRLVIVPGGKHNSSQLLVDPRVHCLISSTIGGGGYVATLQKAAMVFAEAGIPDLEASSNFVAQGDYSIEEFSRELVDLVLY